MQADKNNNNDGDNDGWESVPQKQPRRKRKTPQETAATTGANSGALPWISYIFPTTENSQATPFMLLLCGIPGSGKSTFAKSLETSMPYKFVRINQDDLGNRKRCEDLTRTVLERGQCPVIDRCNFDKVQRDKFIAIAREFNNNSNNNNNAIVHVECVVLGIARSPQEQQRQGGLATVEECIQRCQKRKNHPTLAAKDARSVVTRMARQMDAPTLGNGEDIRHVRYIADRTAFNKAIVEYQNR